MSGETTIKLPNAMTYQELIDEGKTPEQADQKMHERVFGVGFQRDNDGNVIEQGKGGPLQQTGSHKMALTLSEARQRKADGGGATSDVIAAAVAAGVKAGLAQAKEQETL